MLRSYLTLALRTLRRRRAYTAVNILGLTIGLACCALVAAFLQHELAYDRHHDAADRLYRVLRDYRSSTYSTIPFRDYWRTDATGQRALAERLPQDVPAIEQAANFEILNSPTFVETADGERFRLERRLITNTGPAFVDLFAFEHVAGAPLAEALAEPYSVVLTERTAQTYFGDAEAVGQTLRLDSLTTTVRAVVADPPATSRVTFDLALQAQRIPNWGAYHYVRLAEGADPAAVAPQISAVMDVVDPRRVENATTRGNQQGEHLQAMADIHFAERALYDDTPHRNPTYLWAFGAIGLLILTITTINYANLALALYAERGAEIGIRKAVGGHPRHIAGQFLVEAVALALLCVPLALALAATVLPVFNDLLGTAIAAGDLLRPALLGALAALAALAGLIAGAYPALVLGTKQTVELFERALGAGPRRAWSLRHGLIALQFAVLIGLGSLSWIAFDQLRYMQRGALGFETEGVVRLSTFVTRDSTEYVDLRQRLLASSAVVAVGTGVTPNPGKNRMNIQAADSDVEHRDFYQEYVDLGWFAAMGVAHPVVEAMRAAGPAAAPRVLINQAAAERFGYTSEAEAVGAELIIEPDSDDPPRLVVDGVLPNLHLRPMRDAIQPTVFRVTPTRSVAFGAVVRFAPGRLADGMAHVRAVWPEVRPDTPLEPVFLDDQVAALYEQERVFTAVSAALAGLAILLAALGLASLVAYLTRLRLREIGVRKALGGSVGSIVVLLNREYVRIVAVAFLVGAPLAWAAADWWLGQFAYQVGLSPWVFLASGVGALAIAVLAVSMQALRAARVDPAQVLRTA